MAANTLHCQEGYDDIHFSTEIPDELRCIVCHLVLRDPVQVMSCGHRFCSSCFEKVKIHAQQTNVDLLCPVDREEVPLNLVFPDKAASRTIGNLSVRCANKDRGCSWDGDLRDLKDHEDRCGFKMVSGMKDLSVNNGGDKGLYTLVQQLMSRMENCESDLLAKDKDISNLKYTVAELKEDNMIKDQEMKMLKLSNIESKNDSTAKENEMKTLKDLTSELQKEVNAYQQSSSQRGSEIIQLRSSSAMMEKQMKELKSSHSFDEQLKEIDNQISAVREKIEQSIKESSQHIENLENVLFAHNQLPQIDSEIVFRWVMPEYQHMFKIGKSVTSPVFHTKICGYSFRLILQWKGSNKEKIGLFLDLQRGKTPHRFLGNYNHEYTLTIHGRNGLESSVLVSQETIKKSPQAFVIRKGSDTTETMYGSSELIVAPFDDFILNNSLLISCTIKF